MPLVGLIDSGAILAILESDDRWHSACVAELNSVQVPLLTTEAVLTEAFHLIGVRAHNVERLWDFVRSGALTVKEIRDNDLPALHRLMTKYSDRPMDFADATLVHVAIRENIGLILTVDHDDFETYRLAGNKKFIVRPQHGSARRR